MIYNCEKINKLRGELTLPGDKSISHRAVIFGSMADGISKVSNLLDSDDVNSTISCFRNLGIKIEYQNGVHIIHGRGLYGLSKPEGPLYCGNSGTTSRLLMGLLSVQDFDSVLTGDESLSKRPMKRISEPLNKFGADIKLSPEGLMPIEIYGNKNLKKMDYKLPIASAQLKSALILAGLHSDEESIIYEELKSRNHTEVMLGLKREENKIYFSKENYPNPFEMFVPSDISTASFFIVLALLMDDSELRIKNVSLNETRTGIIDLLKRMGAKIEIDNARIENGEKIGDILASSSELENIEIENEIIPNIIDEIPILSVAGLFAKGDFEIRGAEELRVKESDRINALLVNYERLGIKFEEYKDGFKLLKPFDLNDALLESFGDHRIAMAFAVLGMLTDKNIKINNFEAVSVSNPNFLNQIRTVSK